MQKKEDCMRKGLFLMVVAMLMAFTASAKGDKKGVYVMGVSISFSDSVAYFTEVQLIDGVELEKGTKFLPERQHYTHELQDYMTLQEGKQGRTSIILFDKKEKSLKKKELKIKNRLQKRRGLTVRYLGDRFKFTRP